MKVNLTASFHSDQKFGDTLKEQGKLTEEMIATIVKEQNAFPGKKFGEIALSLDFLGEADVAKTLAVQSGLAYLDLKGIALDPALARRLTPAVAEAYKVLPLCRKNGVCIVGIADPFSYEARMAVFEALKEPVEFCVVEPSALTFLIQAVFVELSYEKRIDELVEQAIQIVRKEDKLARVSLVPELFLALAYKGLADGATDIHLVADRTAFRVFYRVRSQLMHFRTYDRILYDYVASYVKQAAGMSSGDRLHLEDGSLAVSLGSRQVYLRVSKVPTVPAQEGESLVLRILDKTRVTLKLTHIGFYEEDLERFKKAVLSSYGMVLITGPTGSGKTTTLYSALLERNPFTTVMLTVEEPVEYQIPGIRQVQVNPAAGITFASALRAFLRQDPDVILVGEIRDRETAETAVHAALTGHLVLSTLHTNTAVETIPRLEEFGITRSVMASALLAVMAQRLVRVLCPRCKKEVPVTEEDRKFFRENGIEPPVSVFAPFPDPQCEMCGGTGFSSMTMIYELLFVDREIQSLIMTGASLADISVALAEKGMQSFVQTGLRKVMDGVTCISEVQRFARF